jgi:hypothetical protein
MGQGVHSAFANRAVWGLLAFALLAPGCSTTSQVYSAQIIAAPSAASLKPGELASAGIAFVTPTTVTGQEEDKLPLALAFAQAFVAARPGTRVLSLTETLSSVNRGGLAERYQRMIVDYRDSRLLDRDALAQVGNATGVRYVAVVNMAAFQQVYHDRFGLFGLRVLQTKQANIRLTIQIWDSRDGSVAWEGSQELHMSDETAAEDAVSFGAVVQTAAERLIAQIP